MPFLLQVVNQTMDLGYSSDSDSEVEDHHTEDRKQEDVSLDVTKVFAFQKLGCRVARPDRVDIADTFRKVLDQRIENSENDEDVPSSDELNLEEEKGQQLDGVPAQGEVAEFDMGKFYKENQEAIESGGFSETQQQNSGKITLHRGTHGVGRLDDVIRFNINNREKIMYQNSARIAKEKAAAKNKH